EVAGRMIHQNGQAKAIFHSWADEQADAAAILQAVLMFDPSAPVATAEDDRPRIKRRTLASVTAAPVECLPGGVLLKSALQLVVGDPGLGKTRILLEACANVTRGRSWPDDGSSTAPRNVLYLGQEDSAEQVIRPVVVEGLGGDPERFHLIDALELTDRKQRRRETMFCLSPDGIEALDATMTELRPALVVIDPITGYLGGADSFKDSEVRERLMPLAGLAQKYGAAVIGNGHMTKDQQRAVAYRVGGSIAFYAVARAVFYVVEDPRQPTRRAFFHQKGNMAELAEARGFSIVGQYLDERLRSVGVPSWDSEPVDFTLEEALRAASEGPEANQKRESVPQATLRSILLSHGGRAPAEEVYRLAEAMGVPKRTLERAKDGIGVTSHTEGFGAGSTSYWCLPAFAPGASEAAQ
ncbi:MAG TPA: AAA family ATPase, partial [Chloroflexota bacterium]|nr:AAA family ATPase [Chloroflexota bacterium]